MPPLFVASAPVAVAQARKDKSKRVAPWQDTSEPLQGATRRPEDLAKVPTDIPLQAADVDGGPPFDVPATEAEDELVVGDTVWTLRSMYEKQGEDIRVGEGWQGEVIRLDEAGDALVDFWHGAARRWVRKKHFGRLRVEGGDSSGRASPLGRPPPPNGLPHAARPLRQAVATPQDGASKVRPKFPTLLADLEFAPLVLEFCGPLSPIEESPLSARGNLPLLEASRRAHIFTLVEA